MLRTLGRIAYRWYLIAIVAGVVIVAVLALFRPATTAIHTAAFAAQVLPAPVKFQPWLAAEPEHRRISFRRDDGPTDRPTSMSFPMRSGGPACWCFWEPTRPAPTIPR